ncbi:hypothetical protein DKP76_13445 [Falsochrobactrum shanghaiense]|uniref:Phage tail protein n=1 Tax=Falsochrobactrum shanghaiense TaxID=2201899 RepID=A0A316J8C3_9HYPH|nr:hypothetical protein [Falsochrobactrum shanghaiense]PWL17039.1 hypothetical protein DKP76_13445 [Falsochrobactrum shanghaiense]
MASIYDWSTTPGNNATADADINWSEGMFPSVVNDSARMMMTRLAEWVKDQGILTAMGSATGVLSGSSTLQRWTWGNIKLWLRDFFDARFIRRDGPASDATRFDFLNGGVNYLYWRSAHVAFTKQSGPTHFYWRRNDTGAEGGGNQHDLMTLNDAGLLKVNGINVGDTNIQNDGNINGAAFNGYLTTFIANQAQTRAEIEAAKKTAPQNCSHASGILEFGSIDPFYEDATVDLPNPWVVVGIRSQKSTNRVWVRGIIVKNHI